MLKKTSRLAIANAIYLVLLGNLAAADQPTVARPADPLYESVADEVYLQEVGERIPTDRPVTSIAAQRGEVHAVVDKKLYQLVEGQLHAIDKAPSGWRKLYALQGRLWGTAEDGVYRIDAESSSFDKVFDAPMVDLCVHNGELYGATSSDVFRFVDEEFVNIEPSSGWLSSDSTVWKADGTQVLADPVRIGPIRRMASYSGTLYLLLPGGPRLLSGPIFETDPVDWGTMPSDQLRDMRAQGSRLYIATDRGVAVLRGAALTTIAGPDGLPFEDATCLTPGASRDLWIGTTRGAVRKMGRAYQYFGADHWLPGEHVHEIAVDGSQVLIATDKGIGVIRYEPFTLRKKAEYFLRSVQQGGHQRLGFVHRLYWDHAGQRWLREISDNDGGHTAHYLAAMCFKYAVTGDEAARREAQEAFEAMRWLQTITETDGFFARSIWAVDVDQGGRGTRGSGGLPAKWYPTKDGKWLWKGDTSSDEVNAHFYAIALFHDLAATKEEKKHAVDHLARIAQHIIDNGWVLRDMDGEPTRWGRWDPEYLQRPYGFDAIGLNGMEAQTYMWTALQLAGDHRFRTGLEQLLTWRYHHYTVREKLTFPPEHVVPWDDELAFRCFLPLLTYCDDPELRSIYLRAIERHWEVLRMQKLPFFNFVYGGLTGNDCEAREAVEHLREWSLDTVSHRFHNSHRSDLHVEPGYTPYLRVARAISPRNQDSSWGSRSALHYDGGSGGRSVIPPVGWLEDYWMGRYFGMIEAPTTNEPELISISADKTFPPLAAPYDGPQRPGI